MTALADKSVGYHIVVFSTSKKAEASISCIGVVRDKELNRMSVQPLLIRHTHTRLPLPAYRVSHNRHTIQCRCQHVHSNARRPAWPGKIASVGMSVAALASVALASSAGETMHMLITFPVLQEPSH